MHKILGCICLVGMFVICLTAIGVHGEVRPTFPGEPAVRQLEQLPETEFQESQSAMEAAHTLVQMGLADCL